MADKEPIIVYRDHDWVKVNSYDEAPRVMCAHCGEERQLVFRCRQDDGRAPFVATTAGDSAP